MRDDLGTLGYVDPADDINRKRSLRVDRANHSRLELNDVLSTYSGRAVLSGILKECGMYANIPTDPCQTFRALGKRDVGLWIRENILTAGGKYGIIDMENESRKREQDLEI